MGKYVDDKRRDLQFQVGDLVSVKLQPHRQCSVAERASHKLSAHYFGYFGPFKVLKRIRKVAY